ncbi:MAG: hypothetical protein P8Y20_07805 [Gammaproteobacteria bacterium]|jgi:hypothetical protein
MELQSKKLSKEIKDLENINDADLDTSDIQNQIDTTHAEIGKFQASSKATPGDTEIN